MELSSQLLPSNAVFSREDARQRAHKKRTQREESPQVWRKIVPSHYWRVVAVKKIRCSMQEPEDR